MTESDLLDLLLGAIIVLVAAIGYWQGIVRGLLFLAGTLLGSELALWWSDDLGDRLADWFPLNADTGRFIASTFFILVSMILIGGGFGALVRRLPGDWKSRLGGICIGVALGVISMGLVIRYFFIHMESQATDALSETRIADFLWEQFDWIILAVVAVCLVMIIVGWVLGPPEESPVQSRQAGQAWAPPALPAAPVSRSNAESSLSNAPVQPRFSAPPSATSTMARDGKRTIPGSADPQNYAREYGGASGNLGSTSSQLANDFVNDQGGALYDDAAGSPQGASMSGETYFAPHIASVSETLTFATEAATDRRESSGMCPNCGMLLRTGDSFCPDCGFPVEK